MAVREVVLVSDPPVGLTLKIDGQEYTFVGISPYRNKADEVRDYRSWATRCRTCDEPFECYSDERMTYMARRCKNCRPQRNS